MTHLRSAVVAGVAALLAASACAHGDHTATASVVRGGAHCGRDEAGTSARWIGTEEAYRAAFAADGLPGDGGALPAPAVDFARDGLVAVEMGRRPTAGYALALVDPRVEVADGVATLVVRFDGPPAGAMVAQVLTSPCLLVRLPRAGVREVRVVDPTGALRAATRVP